MAIKALDLVPDCYTWESGTVIYKAIISELSKHDQVTISFDGVRDVPSSFVNAAFVHLLQTYSLNSIMTKVKVVDSTKQINDMIKRRLFVASELTGATQACYG